MGSSRLDDAFGINPIPRRSRQNPGKARLVDLYKCEEGKICIYIIGPNDERYSKVGVSRTPYNRLKSLGKWRGQELRICYFAEIGLHDGFKIEKIYHTRCKQRGEHVEGEWICAERKSITRDIRAIMADLSLTPSAEFGDTGDDRIVDDLSKPLRSKDRYIIPVNGRRRRYSG